MSQVKRAWFFDSNPDASGTRFRTSNIPSEETYINLVESAGFPGQPEDMATTNKQGFVVINVDGDAIQNRDNVVFILGKQYVLKIHQAPGTGIKGLVNYEESNPPTDSLAGTPVIGNGIKITGVIHQGAMFKRIGYQVELNLESLNIITPVSGTYLPILNPDGSQGLVLYNDGRTPDTDKLSYTHSQDIAATTWTVNHSLGWRPNINIEIACEIIDTEWVHIDDDTIEVRFTSSYSGKVYCS